MIKESHLSECLLAPFLVLFLELQVEWMESEPERGGCGGEEKRESITGRPHNFV